jgi:hypothetical protein
VTLAFFRPLGNNNDLLKEPHTTQMPHRITSRTRFVFLLLTLLAAGPALAAKSYDVEVIVFERTSGNAVAGEQWPEDPGRPALEKASSLNESGSGAYSVLPKSRWRLSREADRIGSAGGMKVLLHTAWRQPAVDRDQAKPIHLHSSVTPLEGTATISVGRYLHADLDLLLNNSSGGSYFSSSRGGYRLQESRRMRSGEVHYFDHPMMGALVLISANK